MKLLCDHNISPHILGRLADIYPDATHVALVGLERATDPTIWEYTQANGCIIVTKDADFSDLSTLRGFPPKVIWLRTGNCTTSEIEALLRRATRPRFLHSRPTTRRELSYSCPRKDARWGPFRAALLACVAWRGPRQRASLPWRRPAAAR
jgi:predicted nuclease of predicted toxin-antitoxin system